MTTTTTLPEDLERRPSPETAYMLLLLAAEGPLDYQELAERLGVTPKQVRDRIRYFARKGWVTRNSPFIALTDLGMRYVQKYAFYLERVAMQKYGNLVKSVSSRLSSLSGGKERIRAEKSGLERNRAEKVNQPVKCLETLLSELGISNVSEEARLLLEALLENFLARGSSYLYAHVLMERQGWDRTTLMRAALELKGYGIIYVWRDGKIGLRKRIQSLGSSLC